MNFLCRLFMAGTVALWLGSEPDVADAHQPLCEILTPVELLSRWGFPIDVEIWVEDRSDAYLHTDLYNYLTRSHELDRPELEPLEVPYRVGMLRILSTEEIEWHMSSDATASVEVINVSIRGPLKRNDRLIIIWKHLGWFLLNKESTKRGDPLFPMALIFDLIEEGFVPKVGGLSGREIDDTLGYWISRKYWRRTVAPPVIMVK